jgi:putative transcriptional regulator
MITIELNEVLQKKRRSLYWLAQNSGVPYVTLWNLNKTTTQRSINLPVLSRICAALECLPGDLLRFVPDAEDEAIQSLIKSKTAKVKGARKK